VLPFCYFLILTASGGKTAYSNYTLITAFFKKAFSVFLGSARVWELLAPVERRREMQSLVWVVVPASLGQRFPDPRFSYFCRVSWRIRNRRLSIRPFFRTSGDNRRMVGRKSDKSRPIQSTNSTSTPFFAKISFTSFSRVSSLISLSSFKFINAEQVLEF
jgi:hypothetical protein